MFADLSATGSLGCNRHPEATRDPAVDLL